MMLPSILKDLCPDKDDFTCRRWLLDKGRWCLNRIEKTRDRPRAAQLAASFRHSDTSKLSVKALEELAEICYCKRWHRNDPVRIEQTARHWLEELRQKQKAAQHAESEATSPLPGPPKLPVGHRPVTRSMTRVPYDPLTPDQRADRDKPVDELPQFAPYKPQIDTPANINTLIIRKMKQQLAAADRDGGYIFIYSRPQNPGFVKIGYSSFPERRLLQWAALCGQEPVLRYTSPFISNARRAEQLIFLELSSARRRERCMNGRGCGREHREWFEMDIAAARASVIRWTNWLGAKPYDERCQLLPSWVKALELSPGDPLLWQSWIDLYIPKIHWSNIWNLYSSHWGMLNELAKTDRKGEETSQNVSLEKKLLWPVESASRADITEENITLFLSRAPQETSSRSYAQWVALLKIERVRWHPDKMQQRYGRLGMDGTILEAVTAVAQIMNKLWERRHVIKIEGLWL